MSDDGTIHERPLESPAVPADEVEIDPLDVLDDERPVTSAPPGSDWEADPLDVQDQQREVPLDDDR